jgi:hypothetical protein
MVCDANGVPLRFMRSPGQVSDIAHTQPLLDQVRILGKPGRQRKRSRWLLTDKGYDAKHLRYYCDRYRMQPVITPGAMPRNPRPGLTRLFDRPKYRSATSLADVWRAIREPPNRQWLRQAGPELRSHGHAGLQPTLYAEILFVQNLAWRYRLS